MIQYQLKLKLTNNQQAELERWMIHLASIYNWGIRKIELNANNKIYFSKFDFQNSLPGLGKRLNVPGHTINGILISAYESWDRCFKKLSGKPKLKGVSNKLNYAPFIDPFKSPVGNRISVPGLGKVRFHKQEIPAGKIKCGRIVKRASGWYLCLFIDSEPRSIPQVGHGVVGVDPGFKHLLTLSDGSEIDHPRELEATAKRLAQSQRGRNKKLTARLHERNANQRKDRNHKLSRKLVSENAVIVFSADSHKAIAKKFGRSVTSSSHAQLRSMLAYKCRTGGRQYIEVSPKKSTMTCSCCGALSGPTGWTGLQVRKWTCTGCGSHWDRDVNAALNTLYAGVGRTHEVAVNG